MRFWLSDRDLTSATTSFLSSLYLRSCEGVSASFLRLVLDVLILQPAQFLVSVGDPVEGFEHFRLQLRLHRRKRDGILHVVVVVERALRHRRFIEPWRRIARRGRGCGVRRALRAASAS